MLSIGHTGRQCRDYDTADALIKASKQGSPVDGFGSVIGEALDIILRLYTSLESV
jgi:hypothetical protein